MQFHGHLLATHRHAESGLAKARRHEWVLPHADGVCGGCCSCCRRHLDALLSCSLLSFACLLTRSPLSIFRLCPHAHG